MSRWCSTWKNRISLSAFCAWENASMPNSKINTLRFYRTLPKRITRLIWTRCQGSLPIVRSIGCCSLSICLKHSMPPQNSLGFKRASIFKYNSMFVISRTMISKLCNNRHSNTSRSEVDHSSKSKSLFRGSMGLCRRILRFSQCLKTWEHLRMRAYPSRFSCLKDWHSLTARRMSRTNFDLEI